EHAASAAEIAELEARLAAASGDASQALRAELAKRSIAARVISTQTALLVLETERDYARYGIDRKALADIIVIGDRGLARQPRVPLPDATPAAPPRPGPPPATPRPITPPSPPRPEPQRVTPHRLDADYRLGKPVKSMAVDDLPRPIATNEIEPEAAHRDDSPVFRVQTPTPDPGIPPIAGQARPPAPQ